ncbi:MAG: hypothetical protein Q4E06_03630 [Lautropia sp.]|nr:hypothetical protein [Lautropia sp.]
MPISHDQNFKNLILDYPRQALAFFAAEEAARIDPSARITPIRQEQLKDRLSDRFFELDVPLLVEWGNGERESLLFMLEEESNARRFSIHRLGIYALQLAEHFQTDRVVPVVIFLRTHAGLRTVLHLATVQRSILHFQPLVFELGNLDSRDHLDSNNLVTRLTLPCMRHHSLQEQVDARGRALQGLLALEPDPEKRLKYDQFIRYYAPLDEQGQRLYSERYATEEHQMNDIAEQLRAEGRQQGIQQGRHKALVELAYPLLEQRFGPVDDDTRTRIHQASAAELQRWILNIPHASRLEEVFRLQ